MRARTAQLPYQWRGEYSSDAGSAGDTISATPVMVSSNAVTTSRFFMAR